MTAPLVEGEAMTDAPSRDPRRALSARNAFLLFVIVPTLIGAFYFFAIASNQYQSKTAFIVRGMQPEPATPGGLGQLLGLGGALTGAQKEAQSVREYLLSADAIRDLRARGIDVVAVYARADVDPISRLRARDAERVLDYYQRRIDVTYTPDDAMTRVSVRAFTPTQARAIAKALLAMGEARINTFNTRALSALTDAARADLTKAEIELNAIQRDLTGFRDLTRDLDPAASGQAQVRVGVEQDVALARERALYADMSGYLAPGAPQMVAMRSRIAAMEASASRGAAQVTGNPQALARRLAQYEELKLKQSFAAKRYETARANVEAARAQAEKQRLFIVPVTEPTMPERRFLPRPWRSTAIMFGAFLSLFAIGWLVLAGVREHRA